MKKLMSRKQALKTLIIMTSKIEIFIPVKPVSASRPRVTSFGSYYSKSYMAYRKETHSFLKALAKKYPVKGDKLKDRVHYHVEAEFICYKPKKPSDINCPRYDLDNMEKAIYDAITHAKMIWHDDIQIVSNSNSKRYQKEGEPYGTKIIITEV
jgi:Holliday junction resolvase RusA-like endonuclease